MLRVVRTNRAALEVGFQALQGGAGDGGRDVEQARSLRQAALGGRRDEDFEVLEIADFQRNIESDSVIT
jgi:hypothetical protein